MNAPLKITPESLRAGDRAFLRQLKTATREQLRAMLEVFTRLAPNGPETAFAWKRAAVERRLGLERVSFGWLEREELR